MKLLNKILLLVLLSFLTVVAGASYTEKSASGDFLQAQELYQGKSLVKWLSHQEKIKKLGWEASGCCVAPNKNTVTAEDFRGYNEGKWINPSTGKVENITADVVSKWGKIEKDHILPKKSVENLPGFNKLSRQDKKKILNDYDNLQPLPKRLNCSKSNCTQDASILGSKGKPWNGHNNSGLNENYADALKEYQLKMVKELEAKIEKLL